MGYVATPWSSKFSKSENKVKYCGEDKSITQYLTDKLLEINKKYSIHCKIIKAIWGYITFGVVDKKSQKAER